MIFRRDSICPMNTERGFLFLETCGVSDGWEEVREESPHGGNVGFFGVSGCHLSYGDGFGLFSA